MDMLDNLKEIQKEYKNLCEKTLKTQGEIWEAYYKERCPKYFIPWEQLIKDLAFWNNDNGGIFFCNTFIYKCASTISDPTIKALLNIMEYHNYTEFGNTGFEKMICEACACQGCPYMEEHLGHTCRDCKLHQFKYYNGYCDE